ncbi:hypothetical protein [Roseateles puraquae]|uniref:DUF3617 domain-containing protein n=1 Tax=Roseateles puraquae TaxID=431059 RepID=A0A254N9T3_9BURK|nr:hypothetical protein [Roseateles puraquae]MDG0853923.1 hypothetical protein [Roseateles puraquae]OWR04755.1 hypothetical protein CDO81_09265 [Roseateles puraquae]
MSASLAHASPCAIDGEYLRKDGANLSISAASESPDGSISVRVQVQAFGNIAPDGAPRYGNLEGELQLSRDHCAGVVVSEELRCKMVFNFADRTVQLREIGRCFTGTGVSADGLYSKRPNRVVRGSPNE